MTPRGLWFIARSVWIVAVLFVLGCVGIKTFQKPSTKGEVKAPLDAKIPQFVLEKPLQEALSSPCFTLTNASRGLRLPDLRQVLVYYGTSERPDSKNSKKQAQFSWRGVQAVHTAQADDPVYVRFEGGRWHTSETKTPLSISFRTFDNGCEVRVDLTTEDGHVIKDPGDLHLFSLLITPLPPNLVQTREWSIGAYPADPALLDHEKALWYGKDVVLQTLGGDDFKEKAMKERIQFGEKDSAYALYVKERDAFVFDGERWEPVELGEESREKPLLVCKTIGEKAIRFDLWDEDGSHHLTLDLPKRDVSLNELRAPDIKIIGARTRKKWIVEIQSARMILSQEDWVVVSNNEVTRLDSQKDLEDFLEGRISGTLLAFQDIKKESHELMLQGVMVDSFRTKSEPISIALLKSSAAKSTYGPSEQEEDDDDDDDVNFEDFEDDDNEE